MIGAIKRDTSLLDICIYVSIYIHTYIYYIHIYIYQARIQSLFQAKKNTVFAVFWAFIVVTSDPQRLTWRLLKGLQVDLGGGDHICIYIYVDIYIYRYTPVLL